jgi:hypothetical protein
MSLFAMKINQFRILKQQLQTITNEMLFEKQSHQKRKTAYFTINNVQMSQTQCGSARDGSIDRSTLKRQ